MAEVAIEQSKDSLKDKLDAFASVGARAGFGDVATENNGTNSVNEQDYALALGVEYSRTLDKSNVSAEISQAKIDRVIAQREIENIKRNLKFNIASLSQEISKTIKTIEAMKSRRDKEREKLAEGEDRYRRGRGDTQQLILFENDLSLAQFLLQQQRIELAKKYAKLDIIRGTVWKRVVPLEKP
jgi:outer membrane protein TolC